MSRRRALPVSGEPSTGATASRRLPLAPEARDVDRAARPVYAVWELTLRCDLACRHCGSRAGRARPDELTTDEALDLVDQLAELGVREVTLIGGEAYLRNDWLDVVRRVRERGMRCTMTTGGRSIDRAKARAAKEAGLQAASVSLDGLEATHDAIRGLSGSFASALAALGHLHGAGIPVAVNTQIHRANRHEIPALLDVVVRARALAWQVALTVPMGRAADDPDMFLQPYDLLELFPMLAREARRARGAGVRFVRGNDVGYFGPFEEIFEPQYPDGFACGCGAGREILGIEADGTIKGCPSLASDPWIAGSVRDCRLRDIWERGSALQALRGPRETKLWGYCATCYYAKECGGGCTWMADSLFRKPGNNPYCHHRALEHERAGLRERVVRVEAPPGAPFDRGRFELLVEPLAPDDGRH